MTEDQVPDHFVATNSRELKKLEGFIHEEYFDPHEIKYDASTKVLEIPFERCNHGRGRRKVKERILWRVHRVPVLQCGLRISNVENFELDEPNVQGHQSVFGMKYDYNEYGSTISIDVSWPGDFKIQISDLHIEYYEIGFRGIVEITSGFIPPLFFWDKAPKFLED